MHVDHVVRGGSRLGIYFAEAGASQRASVVVYDRAHSAVSELAPGTVPWSGVFAGADVVPLHRHHAGARRRGRLHARSEAVEAARRAGARVSVDLNFRRKLWSEHAGPGR